MAYLEDHGLLYLELAARNVFMTSDLVCKLQVCGLVRRCQDGSVAGVCSYSVQVCSLFCVCIHR